MAAQGRGRVSPEAAFGRVLRQIRTERSLSQEELGFKSGYHRTYIGLLERGEKSPSLRTLFNLAATLNVSPSTLVRNIERLVAK
jgi:transcriptional regulator with XRE-family HTH domain